MRLHFVARQLCFFGFFVITTLPLFCRDIDVSVVDGDLDMPLEGAVIKSPDGKIYECKEDGTAQISIGDTETGSLEVTYPGYKNQRIKIEQNTNRYVVRLSLGDAVLEGEEIRVEGVRQTEANVDVGRSVSLSRANTELTAQIGLVEDIMNSIKLLPGVGYSGMFDAHPSIRGGMPGDMEAVIDGFYVDNPYHWGGGYSIFDPKFVETARLYHGVFSARYSHTISGLLEVKSKKASSENVSFEFGFSTSATSLVVSSPIRARGSDVAKGGFLVIGKVTYWDPFVWGAQGLAKSIDVLKPVNAINVAPYIRSLAASANYSFSDKLGATINAYIGGDGIGVLYSNKSKISGLNISELKFDWDNLIGFVSSGLQYNPDPTMSFKTTLGIGFHDSIMQSDINYQTSDVTTHNVDKNRQTDVSIQAREELDMDLTRGFLLSIGFEELFREWIDKTESNQKIPASRPDDPSKVVNIPYYIPGTDNTAFFTSTWGLLEYRDPKERFYVETGLRLDMLSFYVKDKLLQSPLAVNPRLNFNYYLLKDRGLIDLVTLTAGAGLFSSTNDSLVSINGKYSLEDNTIKQNRAGTGIAGVKVDFADTWSFNLELYYKYIYDRCYTTLIATEDNSYAITRYHFNGTGNVFGFDLMLQKLSGRLLNGWISYSFVYARYTDPDSRYAFGSARFTGSDHSYFPDFHRFSNLNIILNYKPIQQLSIYLRFGFASGSPIGANGDVQSYIDENGKKIYRRIIAYSDTTRSPVSLPLDLKFSWHFFNPGGKVQTEVYLAIENALSLLYHPTRGSTINPYTGEEEEGSSNVSYEIPIPMVSFGFKWSY